MYDSCDGEVCGEDRTERHQDNIVMIRDIIVVKNVTVYKYYETKAAPLTMNYISTYTSGLDPRSPLTASSLFAGSSPHTQCQRWMFSGVQAGGPGSVAC